MMVYMVLHHLKINNKKKIKQSLVGVKTEKWLMEKGGRKKWKQNQYFPLFGMQQKMERKQDDPRCFLPKLKNKKINNNNNNKGKNEG